MINIDETSWREDRRKAWLWVTVTALATVFTIARNRTAKVAQALLGDQGRPGRQQRPVQLLRLDRGRTGDRFAGAISAAISRR